jgi:DHA1 family tetracycline resistance protein-like MFS transporter
MARGIGQCALTFLLMFAIGIGAPISPLFAARMGASWVEIGLMGSAWGLVFTFSALLTGRASDRLGRRPVLAVSSALSALAALLFLRATSVSELIAIRGLEGLAWACFWPPMEALATETAGTEQIGRGIGLVTTVYALGFAIGSLTGGYVTSLFGFPLAFSTYFVLAALSVLAAWFIEAPRHRQPVEGLPPSRLLPRLSSRGLIAGNVLGASYTFGLATIMALLSVYALNFEIPVFWIGVAFSIFWIGRILGAAFGGAVSDRLGRRRVAVTALIAGSVGFVMIGIAPGLLLIVAGAFLAGLSIGVIFPVNVAIIADNTRPALRGAAMGFYEMICAIAFMAASALGGASAEILSPRTPYMLSAIVFVSCVISLSILLPRHQGTATDDPDPDGIDSSKAFPPLDEIYNTGLLAQAEDA